MIPRSEISPVEISYTYPVYGWSDGRTRNAAAETRTMDEDGFEWSSRMMISPLTSSRAAATTLLKVESIPVLEGSD